MAEDENLQELLGYEYAWQENLDDWIGKEEASNRLQNIGDQRIKDKISPYLNRQTNTRDYSLHYGTSLDEIPYAIFAIKYSFSLCKALVIANFEAKMNTNLRWYMRRKDILISEKEIPTPKINQYISKRIQELKGGTYECLIDQIFGKYLRFDYFETKKLPKDATNYPDKYIQPGDVILSSFSLSSHSIFSKIPFIKKYHAGIYIGKPENEGQARVIHVSSHGQPRGQAFARIGNLIGEFVEKDGTIWKMSFLSEIRKKDKIVEIAKYHAEKKYSNNQYDLMDKNCEHFVWKCAIGLNTSPQSDLRLKAILKYISIFFIMMLAMILSYGNLSFMHKSSSRLEYIFIFIVWIIILFLSILAYLLINKILFH